MCAAGLGVFGLVAAAARYSNKAARMPYVSLVECTARTVHAWTAAWLHLVSLHS